MDDDNIPENENNIFDYIKGLRSVWPFSVWFPEDIPEEPVEDFGPEESIAEVEIIPSKEIGHNLHPGVDYGLGLVHFMLKYGVQEEVLKIIIMEGKALIGKDPRGTSDPYAIISFLPPFRNNDYKTSIKMKTLNPVWNHVFVFHNFKETFLRKHELKITLYDWDKYGNHDDLGEITYKLSKLCKKDPEPTTDIGWWIKDYNPDNEFSESVRSVSPINEEDLRIVERSVSMVTVNYEDEEMEVEDIEVVPRRQSILDFGEDENEAVNIIRRIDVKLNLQALPKSRCSYGELMVSLNYSIKTRSLIVTIVKARNMIDPSRRSLIPYCTLRHLLIDKDRELTKGMHKTSYRFYTANPVWNEDFQLNVPPDKLKHTAVEIKILHSTKSVKPMDEQLGLIRIGLKTYPAQKQHFIDFLGNIGKPTAQWHLIRV